MVVKLRLGRDLCCLFFGLEDLIHFLHAVEFGVVAYPACKAWTRTRWWSQGSYEGECWLRSELGLNMTNYSSTSGIKPGEAVDIQLEPSACNIVFQCVSSTYWEI